MNLGKLTKKQLIEQLKKLQKEQPENDQDTIRIDGLDYDVIPRVHLLGKSLNEAIDYANDKKNGVVLINQVADVYKISMWVKDHKEQYPEFYKQIWENNFIWADKLDDDRALHWGFGDWDGERPVLDSVRLPSGRISYRGVLLGRRNDGRWRKAIDG